MSCDGWSVGDRCQAIASMEVDVEFGDDRRVLVSEETRGIVREIRRRIHIICVEFDGIRGVALLDHPRTENLRRV